MLKLVKSYTENNIWYLFDDTDEIEIKVDQNKFYSEIDLTKEQTKFLVKKLQRVKKLDQKYFRSLKHEFEKSEFKIYQEFLIHKIKQYKTN
ncbi:MAG: hypothetical protein WDZ41_00125 [Candidatus Babeliales bacterium]